MADRHTIYKHGAKEIAIQKGISVTYMAKVDSKSAGSSFHLHSSLWDAGLKRNIFWDSSAKKPSKIFPQVRLSFAQAIFVGANVKA